MGEYSRVLAGAAVLLGTGTAIAGPTVIFSDNFNTENGGTAWLNYTGFANWTVADGTVDLIGAGSQWDYFPGQGLYVDLDGSTGNAGSLTKTTAITFESGKHYVLTFKLAGNQRGDLGYGSDTVHINVGIGVLLADTITLSPYDPLVTHTYSFVGNGDTLSMSFQNEGGDNVGAILDDVELAVVPLPSAAGLAGVGLLLLCGRRGRVAR